MDLKIKSKAWVGNIYQRFEAMCQDVDEFVTKDTVKYVGNQVQNVGDGVKKIYSDVVQDLLPPQVIDHEKLIDESKILDEEPKVLDLMKCCSFEPDHGQLSEISSKKDETAPVFEQNIAPLAQNISVPEEKTFSESDIDQTDDYHDSDFELPEEDIRICNSSLDEIKGKDVIFSGDITDSTMETIDLSDKSNVKENCEVTENRVVFPVSGRARSFGSYKKLFKDAFTLRKRLSKEYEQLAIWYGDIDEEASQHFGSNNSRLNPLLTSPKNETWESEWELL